MKIRMVSPAILGLALLAGGLQAAQAGTIYKYRGANGVIEYSTTRPKDRPIIAEMDSKEMAADQRTVVPSGLSSPGARAMASAADSRVREQNQARDNIVRAEDKLKDAQAALEAGREPLPGERTGTVSGFTRLNESYQDRVAVLEQAVQKAQLELDDAYRARP